MTFQTATFTEYTHGVARRVDGGVVDETLVCISLNGQELATLVCSPAALDDLVLGFLRSEGFIGSISDVRSMHTSLNNCVEVWLDHEIVVPERIIKTAGCGGGVTFDDLSMQHQPLATSLQVNARQICELMRSMMLLASTYIKVRGIHTSALCDSQEVAFIAEDVGRHNTIDRLWGQALRAGYATTGKLLVASGRISSEMLSKAVKMGVPVIVSRTSPTALSVALARAWNITIIGYCRGQQFRVYTGEARIK